MSANKLQYRKMTLEELVVLSQQNDFKALEELIRREQKNVFATFSYLAKKRENVADLTQEALLRLAKNIHSLKNPKHFKSWLNQIVTNLFYDELRKSARKPDIISMDEENDDETNFSLKSIIPDKKCKPPEKCISAELEQIIKDAIRALPEQFRIAIVLRELQGLSYEEIAEATNSSVGTVKSRISRARLKLQDGLKSYI
ncbi:TPA: sigma-70 family RNA polymerase sigma factor [Candidatus Scatousia excrementigallinarum]|uniref:Sigma-70 family RNA polymerase sigma factor n=1 Tax=Candidatus Scatousia excrementigallinarum TaxID=2840935 RepID=A0A9D1EYZ4_9BACT|nr:sigma-70 family RNA polymerase sigma factor [Candidatus Scatousia excrementigallinarum]